MMNKILSFLMFMSVCVAGAYGQGAGLPTTLGWFQIPNTAPSLVCPSYPEIQGSGGCGTLTSGGFGAWSGGFMDTRRNRLILRIGGHTDYFGNELYALDLNSNPISIKLAKDASHGTQISNQSSCPVTLTDGSPNSTHNYFGPNFLPDQDRYFIYQAFKTPCGFDSDGLFLFDPSTPVASGGTGYTQLNPATHPTHASNGSVPMFAYDPVTKALYEVEAVQGGVPFWKFDPTTNNFTNLASTGSACVNSTESSAVIDPVGRAYYCVGSNNFWKVSLNSPFIATNLGTPTGCSALVAANGPGIDYDPIQKLIVAWITGNSVIEYNPVTNSCSTVTFTGGPTGDTAAGTFGKFRYAPGVGGFVVVTDSTHNAYFLRLVDPATAALADFNNRAAAPGVLTSQNFDAAGTFNQVTSGEGCFISTATNPVPTHPLCERDTTIARSGASSMRFVVPGKSDDRPGGFYVKGLGLNLANGQTLYVSYSQRMDAGYLLPMPAVGGGTTYLKNHIMAWWNGVNNLQSCANPDWVTVNPFNRGWPSTYMQCGSDTIQHNFGGVPFDEWDHNKVSASATFDQGYDCPFNAGNGTICFLYPTNTWVTYMYAIQLGHYGTADSTLQAWVSTPSSPAWRQFMYEPNHNVIQDPGLSLNMIQLLPYWTGRDGTVDSGATGTTWYDELITSTQPIAPPMAPPAPATSDVYLSQAGAGTIDGSSCANARAVSYFTTSTNWGTGPGQIGSGTTVHLCGVITSTLTVPASQGTGLITMKWEPGASMQQPAAAHYINGTSTNSWLFTGQAPCGFVNQVFVPCTESIKNTNNGSPDHFANQVFPSNAFDFTNFSGASVTVQNLEIGPLYVHDDPTDTIILNTSVNAVFSSQASMNSLTIKNNYVHDVSWAFTPGPTSSSPAGMTITITGNEIFHVDHGFGNGSACTRCFTLFFDHNHYHDPTNWNTNANAYHHDGVHIFGPGTQMAAIYAYDNLFDGPHTGNETAYWFNQGSNPNTFFFNNVMIVDPTSTSGIVLMEGGGGTNEFIANNTGIHSGQVVTSSLDLQVNAQTAPQGNQTVINNIWSSAESFIDLETGTFAPNTATSGLDYNLYANCIPSGNGCFVKQPGPLRTNVLATWQTQAGEGAHSQFVTDAKLSAAGVPQTGSPVLGAGSNLTSLCVGNLVPLCSDFNGVARPISGAWNAGAIGNPPSGGAPFAALSGTSASFLNQAINTTSAIPQTITLTNTGGLALAISSIAITGANATDFGQSNNCGTSLNAGALCTFTITYSPTITGAESATLTITDNAVGSPHTIALSGYGFKLITGVGSLQGQGTIKIQ